MRMSWRLASRLSVLFLALLVVVVVAIVGARGDATSTNATGTTPSGLQGTNLGGTPAPNFRLTDQFGKQISLSQFRGEPVVLTFLYTHCTTVCPLTAEKLHTTVVALGSQAQHVAILAVSVDPKGDTPASVINFSNTHHMLNYWHYLMGTEQQLAPVWSAYSMYASVASANTINHTTALYVIDKQGKEQVFLSDTFAPSQLETDLKILLKQ
ncbi:MAG TPA: SCO family protein [Ktedonobacteraceae bacterium]|nr:SCO family protein [Ktedonobacteraceae bacterium]